MRVKFYICSMKIRAFFLFLVLGASLHAQDSLKQMRYGLRLNRLDFFEENSLVLKKDKLAHEIGLGFGINRSIFQQRLFPELFYALQSTFPSLGVFSCQAKAAYHTSFFQVNRKEGEIHFYNELLLGAHLALGRKYAFFFEPGIGLQAESFHSDFFDRVETGFSFAYSAKIGFSHAF